MHLNEAFGYLTSTIRQAKMTMKASSISNEFPLWSKYVKLQTDLAHSLQPPQSLIMVSGPIHLPTGFREILCDVSREKNESPAPGERSSYDSEKETAPTIFPKQWRTMDDHRKHHLNIKPMALWPANKSYQATTLNQLLRIVLQHAAYLDVRRWWEVWFRESNLQRMPTTRHERLDVEMLF